MKGEFVHRRHDDVRDLFVSLLKDVCHDVEVESHLQPLTEEVLINSSNSSDETRLDVSTRGFWQRGQRAFFDVGVFNPFGKSHLNQKLDTASRGMKTRKSDITTSELLKLSMAPSALSCSPWWKG